MKEEEEEEAIRMVVQRLRKKEAKDASTHRVVRVCRRVCAYGCVCGLSLDAQQHVAGPHGHLLDAEALLDHVLDARDRLTQRPAPDRHEEHGTEKGRKAAAVSVG